MNDSVSAAIAAAQAAASQFQAPVSLQTGGPLLTMPAARPKSLADALASAGTAVDVWLGVNAYGLFIDKDKKGLNDTIDVTIKIADVKFGYGVRYSVGGQTQYGRSYDGLRDVKSGKPWAELIVEAQRHDPKCNGQYDMAEIPMVLQKELVKSDKTKVEAGTRIGLTTSITNYPVFTNWVKEVLSVYGDQADIPVQLGYREVTKNNNTYGLVTFTTRTMN